MIGDALADFEAARENQLQFIGRQAPNQGAVFPAGTPVVPDLIGLAKAAAELYAQAKPVTAGVS